VAEEKGSKRLVREAKRLVEHAEWLAKKGGWQLAAAEERLEKYGVKVAAGWMAANGWSLEAARYKLLGK
jgi:transposase